MDTSENLLHEESLNNWELKQLAKSGLYADEQAVLRSALRALFQVNPQAKIAMVVKAYERGEISLGKAAVMLGVSQEEMKDILRESGEGVYLGLENVTELRKDIENA
jgi:predicted HTH domain antitoxin